MTKSLIQEMTIFKACPRCGRLMIQQSTTSDDQSFYCPNCKALICNDRLIRG